VPVTFDEVSDAMSPMLTALFEAKQRGENVAAAALLRPTSAGDVASESEEVYQEFLADLAAEITADLYGEEAEGKARGPFWKRRRQPATAEEFCAQALGEAAVLLGLRQRAARENLVVRWSQKRRDRVDQILVRELHGEEATWTDYAADEEAVKAALAADVAASALADTIREVRRLRAF